MVAATIASITAGQATTPTGFSTWAGLASDARIGKVEDHRRQRKHAYSAQDSGNHMTGILLPPEGSRCRNDAIRGGMDLLFLVNTRHLRRADELLAKFGLGRAHHRLLYFVRRKPGISIKDILDLLAVTKRSLDRVIKDLLARGLIKQQPGVRDRRQRLLRLTLAGEELEGALFDELQANMDKAYAAAGDDAVAGFWVVLQHLWSGPIDVSVAI